MLCDSATRPRVPDAWTSPKTAARWYCAPPGCEALERLVALQGGGQAADQVDGGADALLGGEVLEGGQVVDVGDDAAQPALGDLEPVLLDDASPLGKKGRRGGKVVSLCWFERVCHGEDLFRRD